MRRQCSQPPTIPIRRKGVNKSARRTFMPARPDCPGPTSLRRLLYCAPRRRTAPRTFMNPTAPAQNSNGWGRNDDNNSIRPAERLTHPALLLRQFRKIPKHNTNFHNANLSRRPAFRERKPRPVKFSINFTQAGMRPRLCNHIVVSRDRLDPLEHIEHLKPLNRAIAKQLWQRAWCLIYVHNNQTLGRKPMRDNEITKMLLAVLLAICVSVTTARSAELIPLRATYAAIGGDFAPLWSAHDRRQGRASDPLARDARPDHGAHSRPDRRGDYIGADDIESAPNGSQKASRYYGEKYSDDSRRLGDDARLHQNQSRQGAPLCAGVY